MFYVLMAPMLLLFVVVQHTVLTTLTFNLLFLEFSLPLVVYGGFRLGVMKGGTASILLGFFMDCTIGTVSGYYMLLYYVVFCVSFAISPHIYAEKRWPLIIFIFLCGVMEGGLSMLLSYWLYGTNIAYNLLKWFVPQLLIVSFLGPVFFRLLDRMPLYAWGDDRTSKRK